MDVERVYAQLVKMGFSKKRLGTHLIADAIIYMSENPECKFLTKGVYRYLARKYHRKVITIRSHILATCKCASKTIGKRVTAKRVIKLVSEYIRKKQEI